MTMRLVLLTTSDVRSGRQADFERLVASIKADLRDVEVRMFVLLQRADDADRRHYEWLLPPGSVVVTDSERVSLSSARNRLLELAERHRAITGDCVVGFPDDDCWYPPGLLPRLARLFRREAGLDMLACRVSLTPAAWDLGASEPTPAHAHQIVRGASSNSMFFRGALATALGPFDPHLGLGTANGGGEDTDYALRGFLRANRAVFVDAPMVGHRPSDLASVARYYRGAAIVLGRYALRSPALSFEFARKLAVGACLTVRLRLPAREYLASVASGLRELLRSRATRTIAPGSSADTQSQHVSQEGHIAEQVAPPESARLLR